MIMATEKTTAEKPAKKAAAPKAAPKAKASAKAEAAKPTGTFRVTLVKSTIGTKQTIAPASPASVCAS